MTFRSSIYYILLTVLFLIILASCGNVLSSSKPDAPFNFHMNHDPYFNYWYGKWKKDTGRDVNVPTVFASLDNGYAGICRSIGGRRAILIDRDRWNRYGVEQREILMYHEIAHCTVPKWVMSHRHGSRDNGCPVSIMRPMLFSHFEAIECYTVNKAYYIKELLSD